MTRDEVVDYIKDVKFGYLATAGADGAPRVRPVTWPWPPETVRLLITALALPLGLWLIQFLVQRAFGP